MKNGFLAWYLSFHYTYPYLNHKLSFSFVSTLALQQPRTYFHPSFWERLKAWELLQNLFSLAVITREQLVFQVAKLFSLELAFLAWVDPYHITVCALTDGKFLWWKICNSPHKKNFLSSFLFHESSMLKCFKKAFLLLWFTEVAFLKVDYYRNYNQKVGNCFLVLQGQHWFYLPLTVKYYQKFFDLIFFLQS